MSARHRHYFKAKLAWSALHIGCRKAGWVFLLPRLFWVAMSQQVETWRRIGFKNPFKQPPTSGDQP